MLKRLFDLLFSLGLLLLSAPVMLVLAVMVRANTGAPALFRQKRPGLGGKSFYLVKFRTMREAYDEQGLPLPDGDRLTGQGRWLRKYSLDELPQLINVLKGELSFVGPRPLLMQYLERYSPEQARRHEVKPGITGWAQINGRNAISWEEKFALDLWYVDNYSFWLDIKILWLTMLKVVSTEGVNQSDTVTMNEFMGSGE